MLNIKSAINNRIRNLEDLAEMPRWVAWREEIRKNANGEEAKRKVPYDPHTGAKAEIPTNPNTWGTRAKAERRWQRLDEGGRGGVGIVLGDLGDGYHLMGIDLDKVINGGDKLEVDPFINKVIERFATYAEISPSRKGIKLFFLLKSGDMDAVRKFFPLTRKTFAVGEHHEIAIDRARFYAVTDEYLEGYNGLRVVSVEDVRWFIEDVGPKFLRLHDRERGGDRDETGSGYGYRYFANLKALGKTYQQAREAIINDEGKAGEWARRVDERQLQRGWENARAYLDVDFVKPKQHDNDPGFTAYELKDIEFPPLKFAVPRYVVAGLTLFAGKPKVGKSYLMLQIANAVAVGGETLGAQCQQGDVLYCALEDNPRRLQNRQDRMRIKQWSKRLTFKCSLPRLDEGGLDFIRAWIEAAKNPRLVIVDTLARIRPVLSKHLTQYDADYNTLRQLQELALEYEIAIVVVHHERKMKADDPYDCISGTLGLPGAADTVMLLHQNRGAFVWQARGRDLDEFKKVVVKSHYHWLIAGDRVRLVDKRASITKAMAALGAPASPQEIATKAKMKVANVTKRLSRMVYDGVIFRHERGKYALKPSDVGKNVRMSESKI